MSLEESFNYQFNNQDLLTQALTHKSYFYEDPELKMGHNEKLEFLGDAVLDLILTEWLMHKFPEEDEGRLSKKRASLVNEQVLSRVAKNLQIPTYLKLGKGEKLSGGVDKPRILASAYEALIGAAFMDSGYQQIRDVVRAHFEQIQDILGQTDYAEDYKTRLQEVIQAVKKPTPVYQHTHEEGPSHERQFYVRVLSGEQILGEGVGKSKKNAEQHAAQDALVKLQGGSL